MSHNQGKGAVFNGLGGILIGIVLLALVYDVFFGPGTNMGMAGGMNGMHGGGAVYAPGSSISYFLGGILQLIIKVLSILLVVGLIMGIWTLIKDYMGTSGSNLFGGVQQLFGVTGANKMACPKCGSSVENRWDFCPDCGQSLTKADKENQAGLTSSPK